MVKRSGGTKRKIKIEKITNKESLATGFTKRRYGLFSKISQLCLLTDAQIAVLATPLSSNSNVSFYSFGHSSVDSIVSAYLTGQRPVREETTRKDEDIGICMARKELGLECWWEDERLLRWNNPEQLTNAINSMSRMLTKLKEFCSDVDVQDQQTVILQSDSLTNTDTVVLANDDANFNNEDQTLTNLRSNSPTCCISGDINVVSGDDLPADFNETTEEQDQIMEFCESFCATEEKNNNVLTRSLDEFDIDQLIDFDTSIFDDWCLETTHNQLLELLILQVTNLKVLMMLPWSDYSNNSDCLLQFERQQGL